MGVQHIKPLSLLLLACISYCLSAQNIGGVVNRYTPITDINGCASHILTVESTQDFLPGDRVLIIQMQGASIDLSNNVTFGNITGNPKSGLYELNRIASIDGNDISLVFATVNPYDTKGQLQLVQVPEYSDVTVTSPLSCKPWDGKTGGVLAIESTGKITLLSEITVSGKGFRGGVAMDANAAPYGQTDYYYPPNPILSGKKGEGIAVVDTNFSHGRGKVANGGGGGNSHNGGGGGGGNGGAGGAGGLEYYNVPNTPAMNTNGIGGLKIFPNDAERLIMGGGGGAGHVNDLHGESGGDGGGIIILNANEVIGNAKKILANGSTVVSAGTERNDGQGGGGAGGTIFIKANSVSGIVAEARGGDGGDCLFYVNSQIIGPGGGGGGGKMLISQPTLGFISSLSGGNNGIANQNLTNGAKPGDSGSLVPNSKLVEATDSATATYINVALSLCPDETVVLAGQTYSAPDTLQLFLAGQNDDCDTIATYTLSLKDAPLNMPNAFTPNGDGKNDLFRPVTHKGSDFAAISLEIYSRWGEKLHTSTGPNAQWDGNIKDSAAPSDIYVWVLYYEDCTGAVQKIHGQITLLR